MINIKGKHAQTAIELAVFGTILIFMLSVIMRGSLNRGLQQQATLKATRMALTLSYTTSAGMTNSSRNSATVLVVEDRLTANSAKYGAVDRTPFITQGSGTHSANLFMPVDFGDDEDLPVFDVIVNGRHFTFSTAAFRTVNPVPAQLLSIADNHPLIAEWCDDGTGPNARACPADNLTADDRFDLDRDGTTDVPANLRERFAWQWYEVDNVGDGDSVDVDGDLKLESVRTGNSGGSIGVLDFQEGDVYFGFDDNDTGLAPGFTNDVKIYTWVHDTGSDGGTYLQIDEGKLFSGDTKQYIRTASKKDSIDLIERVFKISNNTGRFCDTNGALNPRTDNPVEACGIGGGCFTSANITKTCLDLDTLVIFMRSRIADFHGRKWVTDTSDDPYVDFLAP